MASRLLAGTILGVNVDDTSWGTYQASIAWLPCTELRLQEDPQVADVPTMGRPGANGLYVEEHTIESVDVRPRIVARVGYQAGAIGLLLEHAFGHSATTGTGAPYTHIYDLRDAPALGLSMSANRSDDSTEKAGGCRCASFVLTQDKGDTAEPHLIFASEWIGKSTGGEEALVSPTYPPTYIGRKVLASQLTGFTFNGVDYSDSGELLRWEIRTDRKMDRAQSLGSKFTGDPVQTAPMEARLTARFRLASKTLYAAFRAGTQGDISIVYDGATAVDTLTITARNAVIADHPRVDSAGQNVIEVDVTWHLYADGSFSPLAMAITNAADDDRAN